MNARRARAFSTKEKHCNRCRSPIWQTHTTSGWPVRLDVNRLTLLEELQARLRKRSTYQLKPDYSRTSWSVIYRTARLISTSVDQVVLADHECHPMTTREHPIYFTPREHDYQTTEEPEF